MAVLDQTLEYWRAGGYLLLPIAAVCFGIWIYFLKSRAEMLAVLRQSEGLEEDMVARLRTDRRSAAASWYRGRTGMLAHAAAAALDARGDASANFGDCCGRCLRHLRRDMVVLAGLTAAAPLLGLLGTVRGMVTTFTVVAGAGAAADHVAAGISQALITTQVGLVVAIPGVFGIARLQRLLASIQTRMKSCRIHISYGLAARKTS